MAQNRKIPASLHPFIFIDCMMRLIWLFVLSSKNPIESNVMHKHEYTKRNERTEERTMRTFVHYYRYDTQNITNTSSRAFHCPHTTRRPSSRSIHFLFFVSSIIIHQHSFLFVITSILLRLLHSLAFSSHQNRLKKYSNNYRICIFSYMHSFSELHYAVHIRCTRIFCFFHFIFFISLCLMLLLLLLLALLLLLLSRRK